VDSGVERATPVADTRETRLRHAAKPRAAPALYAFIGKFP